MTFNKLEKQKLIDKINLVGTLIGFFMIGLGLFLLLNINLDYLFALLFFIEVILLTWRYFLERKLK